MKYKVVQRFWDNGKVTSTLSKVEDNEDYDVGRSYTNHSKKYDEYIDVFESHEKAKKFHDQAKSA